MFELLIFDYFGVILWLTLAIGLLVLFYKQPSHNHWQRLNIKSLKTFPVFGNVAQFILLRKIYHETINDLYEALGDVPFGGVYQMHDPFLLVKDPKLINRVLIADFKVFSSRGPVLFASQKQKLKNDLTMNVTLAHGERWKMLRQKMSSVFTSYKTKQMYEQVSYCVNLLTEFVDKQMDVTESVDVSTKNIADKLAVEVMGLCFFGIQCHSFERDYSEFAVMCGQIFTTQSANVIRLIFSIFNKKLWHKLNLPDFNKKVTEFFKSMSLDVVSHRRQNKQTRNDFLQLLMNMQNSHIDPEFAVASCGEVPEDKKFNEMDIVANTFAIYLAGFETTSTTLSFCLYELALNQNIQEKVRAEIQQIKEQNGGLNYNSLQEMTYVDAVIAETLRKYPPAPSVTRQSTEDYLIPETNTRLPSGTKIIIPIWSIHHDGRHYPNPEVFDPERFTGENKFKQRNGVYLPFGDGPRICFGKKFAEMELKAAISTIILKYDIKPCAKTEIPLKFKGGSIPLHTLCGLWVNLAKRKIQVSF